MGDFVVWKAFFLLHEPTKEEGGILPLFLCGFQRLHSSSHS